MALAAGLGTPAAAAPVVRSLIVGINDYPYAHSELKGAVNDARAFHDRLAKAPFTLDLAPFPAGGAACEQHGAISIVLIDGCAKRRAILAAFDDLALHADPGDTLLFYFAGHGAQAANGAGEGRTKALSMTSTIVAADSRKAVPGGTIDDIRGTLLNRHISAAQAAGINVVTIFDSCNSGTATRNLDSSQTRSIDAAPANALIDDPAPPKLRAAAQPGSRVHLAAAADGTKALEHDGRGRFTVALVDAITLHPHATYGDILGEVRGTLARTAIDQVPQGEGDLTTTSFLGARGNLAARMFSGTVNGAQVGFAGDGSLSGVSLGSTYALYASQEDALGSMNQLAIARVSQVSPQSALLQLTDRASLANAAVVAREIAHSFGDLVLPVGFRGIAEADIATVLKDLPLVRREDHDPEVVVSRDAQGTLLLSATGSRIATIDKIQAPSANERIGVALRRVANAKALLALPEKPADQGRLARLELIGDCDDCAVSDRSDPAQSQLVKGDRFRLLIQSRAAVKTYPYLFAISPQYGISRLYPPGGASDELAPRGDFYVGETVTAAAAGTTKLVLIVSEVPIPAGPLEQGGLPRSGCDSFSALAVLLCAAASGTRAGDVVPQGDFDVIKSVVTIDKGGK